MPKTDYLENKTLDHFTGKTAYTPPATLYIALFTVTPTDAGGGTEVTGGSYARQPVTAASWNAASAGVVTNAAAVTFPTATASWGTVVGYAIMDASTGGNVLRYGLLTASRAVASTDTFTFAIGAISLGED